MPEPTVTSMVALDNEHPRVGSRGLGFSVPFCRTKKELVEQPERVRTKILNYYNDVAMRSN
jgi:hypothetical protein